MSDLIDKVKEAFNKTPAHLEDFTRVGAERAIKVILQEMLDEEFVNNQNRSLISQFAQRHNIDIGER